MAKAKEPKTASTRAAKPAASRAPAASSRPAKAQPTSPSSDVIQTGARGNGGGNRAQMSPEEVYRLIQETAYYKAKARGFSPGHEVQDWIEAEAEVRMRLDRRA
jgi:hypothetical protein